MDFNTEYSAEFIAEFFNAIDVNNLHLINHILSSYPDFDIDTKNTFGKTALHVAVENNLNYLAKLLINNDADINARDSLGDTPLMKAALTKNIEMCHCLIEDDALVSLQNNLGMDVFDILEFHTHQIDDDLTDILELEYLFEHTLYAQLVDEYFVQNSVVLLDENFIENLLGDVS